jgi:hypothetical protein
MGSPGWGVVTACGPNDSDFQYFAFVESTSCDPFQVVIEDDQLQLGERQIGIYHGFALCEKALIGDAMWRAN